MRCLLILFLALQSVLPKEGESLVFELRYKLGIMNTKVATATISLTPDNYKGRDAMYSHASIRVQPIFRLFLSEKYLSYMYLTRENMEPVYYYNLNSVGYTECYYAPDSIRYERHLDGPVTVTTVPNDNYTMEILSLFYRLRDFEMTPGQSREFLVYLFGGFRRTVVKMVGTDTDRFPGRRANVMVIELPERGLMENGSGNEIYAWIDNEGTRPVLGIEVPLGKGKGTMIANLQYDI